mgnify:CR=1 FL=1
METIDLIITDEYKNVRIDKYLSEQLKEQSRSYIQKLLADKLVTVNGHEVHDILETICSLD